jgi:hypothetical protein
MIRRLLTIIALISCVNRSEPAKTPHKQPIFTLNASPSYWEPEDVVKFELAAARLERATGLHVGIRYAWCDAPKLVTRGGQLAMPNCIVLTEERPVTEGLSLDLTKTIWIEEDYTENVMVHELMHLFGSDHTKSGGILDFDQGSSCIDVAALVETCKRTRCTKLKEEKCKQKN